MSQNKPFIYICDIHAGATPISRKDNYMDSILSKLRHVLEECRKTDAILLIGGDLFDTPRISTYLFLKMIRLFIEYIDIKIIILRGNASHDGTPDHSPLSFLEIATNITTTDDIKYIDINNVRLLFASNSSDPESFDQYLSDSTKNILMTHHIIVEKQVIFPHFLISEFKSSADIILLADYHPKQGIIKRCIDNKTQTFVSCGAFARRKNTTSDRTRIPSYVFINNDDISIIEIPCESDVFVDKDDIVKDDCDILMDVKAMVELIDDDLNSQDLISALNIFAEKMNVDESVKNYVINLLENIQNGTVSN